MKNLFIISTLLLSTITVNAETSKRTKAISGTTVGVASVAGSYLAVGGGSLGIFSAVLGAGLTLQGIGNSLSEDERVELEPVFYEAGKMKADAQIFLQDNSHEIFVDFSIRFKTAMSKLLPILEKDIAEETDEELKKELIEQLRKSKEILLKSDLEFQIHLAKDIAKIN